MSSDLFAAVVEAAEQASINSFKDRVENFRMTAVDKDVERSLLSDDPFLSKAWLAAHAEQIMERRHKEFFKSETGSQMLYDMSAERVMKALVQHRISRGAKLGDLLCDGQFQIKGRFCSRATQEEITSYLSRGAASDAHSDADGAASYLFSHPEGLQLATRYYREVHGLTASFEHSARRNTYEGNYWDVVFQLGEFDEPASNARIQAGCTQIARSAMLGGQKGSRAVKELRVVCALLARHIGRVTDPPQSSEAPAILIGSWLSVESMLSAMAFSKK